MRCLVTAALAIVALTRTAHGDPDPRRTVLVLEYRAGSSALPGVAARVVAALAKQTSLEVLGQDQARAMYGDRLDQVLVKCAGEATCVAKIGQKLKAAEIILVGVSEMGDVILTMQRIDVGQHEVVSRVADSLAAGAAPSDAQLAGAAVTISGEPRGVTPIAALTLHAPASYEIRVEKPGYLPFLTRVALPPEGEIKVEALLGRRGAEVAWYQHWYVLAAAGVVVAGAGGTAIYFATRDASAPAGDGQLNLKATTH